MRILDDIIKRLCLSYNVMANKRRNIIIYLPATTDDVYLFSTPSIIIPSVASLFKNGNTDFISKNFKTTADLMGIKYWRSWLDWKQTQTKQIQKLSFIFIFFNNVR